MFKLDIREFSLADLTHHRTPQAPGLHHIRLLDTGDLVAPLAREVKGNARHAGDFVFGIDFRINAGALAIGVGVDAARFTEINTAR
jgi:hypothetical protein